MAARSAPYQDVPYGAFNFLVKFDGQENEFGGFSDVSGLTTDLNITEYRNGNSSANRTRKVVGTYKIGDVTLKRGVVDSTALWKWIKDARTVGIHSQKNVTITLLDEQRVVVQSWKLTGCVPMKYTGPTLAAKGGGDVAMEELVLSAEDLELGE
jgi:phage tail-like protein